MHLDKICLTMMKNAKSNSVNLLGALTIVNFEKSSNVAVEKLNNIALVSYLFCQAILTYSYRSDIFLLLMLILFILFYFDADNKVKYVENVILLYALCTLFLSIIINFGVIIVNSTEELLIWYAPIAIYIQICYILLGLVKDDKISYSRLLCVYPLILIISVFLYMYYSGYSFCRNVHHDTRVYNVILPNFFYIYF